MKTKSRKVAHFVTTLLQNNGNSALKHYIVIASTTSRAVAALNLQPNEKFLEAREAVDYQLIMDRLKK